MEWELSTAKANARQAEARHLEAAASWKVACEANNQKVVGLKEALRAAREEADGLSTKLGAAHSKLQDKDASLATKDELLQEQLAARVFAEREADALVGQRHWLLSVGVPQVFIVFCFCFTCFDFRYLSMVHLLRSL